MLDIAAPRSEKGRIVRMSSSQSEPQAENRWQQAQKSHDLLSIENIVGVFP